MNLQGSFGGCTFGPRQQEHFLSWLVVTTWGHVAACEKNHRPWACLHYGSSHRAQELSIRILPASSQRVTALLWSLLEQQALKCNVGREGSPSYIKQPQMQRYLVSRNAML